MSNLPSLLSSGGLEFLVGIFDFDGLAIPTLMKDRVVRIGSESSRITWFS